MKIPFAVLLLLALPALAQEKELFAKADELSPQAQYGLLVALAHAPTELTSETHLATHGVDKDVATKLTTYLAQSETLIEEFTVAYRKKVCAGKDQLDREGYAVAMSGLDAGTHAVQQTIVDGAVQLIGAEQWARLQALARDNMTMSTYSADGGDIVRRESFPWKESLEYYCGTGPKPGSKQP
jgi:hypothetical protein